MRTLRTRRWTPTVDSRWADSRKLAQVDFRWEDSGRLRVTSRREGLGKRVVDSRRRSRTDSALQVDSRKLVHHLSRAVIDFHLRRRYRLRARLTRHRALRQQDRSERLCHRWWRRMHRSISHQCRQRTLQVDSQQLRALHLRIFRRGPRLLQLRRIAPRTSFRVLRALLFPP